MSPKRNASGYDMKIPLKNGRKCRKYPYAQPHSIVPVFGVIERDSTFGVMDFCPANYGNIAIGGLQK